VTICAPDAEGRDGSSLPVSTPLITIHLDAASDALIYSAWMLVTLMLTMTAAAAA